MWMLERDVFPTKASSRYSAGAPGCEPLRSPATRCLSTVMLHHMERGLEPSEVCYGCAVFATATDLLRIPGTVGWTACSKMLYRWWLTGREIQLYGLMYSPKCTGLLGQVFSIGHRNGVSFAVRHAQVLFAPPQCQVKSSQPVCEPLRCSGSYPRRVKGTFSHY